MQLPRRLADPSPARERTAVKRSRPTPPELGPRDLARIRTVPIALRPSKVRAEEFARVPGPDRSFAAFLDSLPDILAARDLRAVRDAIAVAARRRRAVVLMLGGHVVKTGLGPLVIELMRRRVVTHVAMNGATAIHDYEVARFGATSEDVARGLADGTFGMAEETGRGINLAIRSGARRRWGMGQALGEALARESDLAHPELSILLQGRELGVTVTVHAALGAEIVHQHPAADGAAIGATSMRDFRRLAAALPALHRGGVVLNVGSAVILPEVFLKALTIARNLHRGQPRDFTTCDLDMQRHYRPRMNVVQRPTLAGGRGYEITGHHEIMLPLLVWGVLEVLDRG